MNIRFVSTLTPEEENLVAPVVLSVITSVLNLMPFTYMIRIDTSDAKVYEHFQSTPAVPAATRGLALPVSAAESFEA